MSTANRKRTLRFRYHRARSVAGVTVTLSTFTLAAASPWFLLALLPPLAWTVGMWRAGTDADQNGLRVRALLGQRRIPWAEVTALIPRSSDAVVARLASGTDLPLTAVTTADLPLLVTASGQQLHRHPAP